LALHVCAREDGIRRSKDLRAEIGKFSNSTNERKQMSIKTIKQRIATVATVAMIVGVLSTVTAPVANAALPTNGTASSLYIATADDTDGTPDLASGAISNTAGSRTSVGWVTDSSATAATSTTDGLRISTAGYTGTVYPGAKIGFSAYGVATSAAGVSVVVTGGTLSGLIQTSTADTLSLAGSAQAATSYSASRNDHSLSGVFSVSAAVGSTATITAYTGTGITGLTTATNGALIGQWVLTVASASLAGVVSIADSYVTQQACVAKGTTSVGTVTGYDTTSRCANGTVGIIRVQLRDAYLGAISTGALAASATNSALVNVELMTSGGGIDAADSYAATSSFESLDPDATNYIIVSQPVANTAGSSVVTITHNGLVVGTKTVSWSGQLATLTIDTANTSVNFANGATEANTTGVKAVYYVAKDAAGNNVSLSAQPSIEGAGALVGVSLSTSSAQYALMSSSTGYGSTTLIIPGGSASTLRGPGSYFLSSTNASGAVIKTAVQNVTVSYLGTDSFTVAWDKTSYSPGEIATMTLTLKDPYGNLVADGTTLTGWDAVAPSGFTAVGTACGASSTTLKGVVTCKYAAGNTGGSYAYSYDVTTNVNAQAPIAGTVAIKTSGTTNEDVLKSIVALIASINKQIQALQKLILRR